MLPFALLFCKRSKHLLYLNYATFLGKIQAKVSLKRYVFVSEESKVGLTNQVDCGKMGKTLMETVVEIRRCRDAVRLVKGPPDALMNTTPEFRHEKASVGGLARYRP